MAQAARNPEDLSKKLERLAKSSHLRRASVGIQVTDLDSGKVLFALDPQKPLIPASCTKLFTSATALATLGPDFQFTTKLFIKGKITAKGRVKGDLVVVGGGDPNISGRFHQGNITAVFEKWAAALVAKGIRSVDGRVIADDTAFDRTYVHPSWPRDQLSRWYCAQSGALSLNDNCVDITVRPGAKRNAAAAVRVLPGTAYVSLANQTKTVSRIRRSSVRLYRKTGTNEVHVEGRIRTGARPRKYYVTVHSPALFFATVLRETLVTNGIRISGSPVLADEPLDVRGDDVQQVAEWRSPLVPSLEVVNQRSQGFYAEQILKTLGWRRAGDGSFAGGLKVVGEFLTTVGLKPGEYEMVDGSGLSRQNRFSASQIVHLLQCMAKHEHGWLFVESLAAPGKGTLAKRPMSPAGADRIRAKTGYIARVSTLSGYVLHEAKPRLAFAILVNDYRTSLANIRGLQDSMCEAMAEWK